MGERERAGVQAEWGVRNSDKDAKLDRARNCDSIRVTGHPGDIKRTVGACRCIHCAHIRTRTRVHVCTSATLPCGVQRRCNASGQGLAARSAAPGWLISCRAFHVTVSLLSRLCHFAASTHAHACPAPQTRYHADRDNAAAALPARAKQIAL